MHTAGVQLEGQDAAKLASLKARLAQEQAEYARQLRSRAFSDRSRYTFCDPAAGKHIAVGLHPLPLPVCMYLYVPVCVC